jgi:small-conductance mechanosensitive channel
VGDFCRYGEDPSSGWLRIGTIESIGLRSTTIRGIDRTVTTIPNSDFARLHIVNMSARDRILLKADLHLRYDTTPRQLQVVLEKLRALLRDHPRVLADPARIRFVGFGDYSLDLEIFAYIDTSDINDFLACQEDSQSAHHAHRRSGNQFGVAVANALSPPRTAVSPSSWKSRSLNAILQHSRSHLVIALCR